MKRFLSLLFLFTLFVVPANMAIAGPPIQVEVDSSNGQLVIKPGEFPDIGGGNIADTQEEIATSVVDKSKTVAQAITAICALVCFVSFILSAVKLSTSGSAPHQRQSALKGLLWSGISLALFGGGWVVVTFFWNLFT